MLICVKIFYNIAPQLSKQRVTNLKLWYYVYQ